MSEEIDELIEELQNIKSFMLQIRGEEVKELLTSLLCDITMECIDPYNEETEKYARRMLPKIDRLNDLLKFRV